MMTCFSKSSKDLQMLFSGEFTTSEMLVNMSIGATLDEFYPAAAVSTLMRVMHDPTLSQHHTTVVQAITFIVKSLGLKCVPYLSQVMPAYIHVIKTSDPIFKEVCIFRTMNYKYIIFLIF